jgi:hypothetical protein
MSFFFSFLFFSFLMGKSYSLSGIYIGTIIYIARVSSLEVVESVLHLINCCLLFSSFRSSPLLIVLKKKKKKKKKKNLEKKKKATLHTLYFRDRESSVRSCLYYKVCISTHSCVICYCLYIILYYYLFIHVCNYDPGRKKVKY